MIKSLVAYNLNKFKAVVSNGSYVKGFEEMNEVRYSDIAPLDRQPDTWYYLKINKNVLLDGPLLMSCTWCFR